jgi:predicted nucleic acid-binding protein
VSEPVLFDTTAHVQAFRQRVPLPDMLDLESDLIVHLSAVVVEELYIGAATADQRRRLDRLWYIAQELGRLITPNRDQWREAGLILQQVRARYGSSRVEQGRMTNDTLIALSARDAEVAVLTANTKDFALLGEFCQFRYRPYDLTAT